MTNSADPDPSEANWSGSALFAKTVHDMISMRRVNSWCMLSSLSIILAIMMFLISDCEDTHIIAGSYSGIIILT